MRVSLELIQQLNFFYKNKLIHLVLQNDLLDALAFTLLVFYLVDVAVPVTDDVVLLELLV